MSTEYANLGFRVDSSGLLTADDRMKRVTRSGKQTESQINSLSKTVGVAAAAFVSLGSAMAIINKTTTIARQFDVLNASLITATGSAEKAESAFIGIQKLAENTPYDLAQVTDAFIKLKNLGLTPSEKAIISYGNTASAMGKDLMQFIEAVADASTAEFERLKEFGIRAKNQGDTIAFTFQGTTKTVKNNAAQIEQYLMRIGEVEFDGAMTRRMETLDGAMSNFSDSWDAMFLAISQNGVGEAIEASVRTGTEYVKDFTQVMNESGHEIQKAGIAISSGIHTAFTQLGGFFDIVGEEMKFAILSPLDFVHGKIIDFLQSVSALGGSALDLMGFDSSSVDTAIANLEGFRTETVTEHNLMLQKMRDDTSKEVKQIEGIYADMFHSVELNAAKMAEKRKRLEKESTSVMSESIKQQEAIFAKFAETKTAPKWIKETKTGIDSLIDQVDNFGGAWTRTGNIIADSMGDAVSLLDDFASKMQSIEKLQADLTNERYKYNDGTKEAIQIDESLARLQQESAKAQIGAIGQTIGLSSQLFKENSKERKALHALEMGFMAVEIALAAEKAVVNAVSAVANQGQGDPYTAFGRIAAMIGVMGGVLAAAGIGFSAGGGGGNYSAPTGGAGTVLGDSSAQSSSISNASERLEDIQTDQLSELMAIRQSMSQLSSGIQNLAKSFATDLDFNSASGELENSNFLDTKLGGILRKIDPIARAADWIDKLTGGLLGLGGVVDKIFGGFSSKKQKLIDSGITFVSQTMQDVFESGNLNASMFQVIETTKKKFWGLSKKKSTSTETTSISGAITSQMADIFGYIGDTVVAAANSLGMDAKHIITTGLESLSLDEALANFVIDIGDVSFADKTGEEIQKELEAIFSQQADLMAQYLVPSITEYQQVGEGAFETLQRVAYEQAIFNDALDRTGVSLKDLSNIMQIDIAQSIISLVGGVEEFSELANSFFDNFYSEAEQFNYLQSSISDVFSELGIGMVASRDEFRNLVEGIDLTTDSGQQLYAALMQVNPAMAEYFNALDDLARDKLGLQIELLNAQGKSEEALAMQRQMELDALDESLHSLQLQVWAQQDLNKAREEERQLLTDNVAFAEQQLEKARQAEIARINSTVEAAEEAYNSTLESINLQREAYNKLINELQSSVDEAASNLQASLNAELSKYDDLISASKERASEEISLINSISSARVSALSSELSLISGIASQYGESSVGVSASEALRAARAGNFEPATRVQTGSNFANATEARISKAREDFALAEIGKLADAQMSDLERTISATESSAQSQIDAINAASEREVAELESQRAAVEEQIKGILGITDTVLSLDEATAQYQKAQDDLQNALAENTLDKLQAQENIALQSLEQAREDAQKQIDALNEQVDSLLNIDNSVSSVDEAIKLLLAERKELAEFEKTMQESQLDTQVQTLQAVLSVESAINESAKAISDMYKDIVLVNKEPPNEMPPITVYPSSAGEDKMSQEIKSMKETMESQNRSIAKSSATTAKILQRIELGGLEVR